MIKISLDEEGVKVMQHYDLRALLRRLKPQCFQRPRVAQCLHCGGASGSASESEGKFNRALLCGFLISIMLTVTNVLVSENRLTHPHPYFGSDYRPPSTVLFGYFEVGQKEKALLVMFAAILVVGVLSKKVPRRFCSSPPETKVQTVSGPILHV